MICPKAKTCKVIKALCDHKSYHKKGAGCDKDFCGIRKPQVQNVKCVSRLKK